MEIPLDERQLKPHIEEYIALVAGLRKRYFRRKKSLEDVYVISIFSVDILVLPPHQADLLLSRLLHGYTDLTRSHIRISPH